MHFEEQKINILEGEKWKKKKTLLKKLKLNFENFGRNQKHNSTAKLITYSMHEHSTDKVRHVEAIGETTRGSMRCRINAIRIWIGTRRGGQEIVVPVVYKRIAKHEKCSCCFRLWSNNNADQGDQQT